MAGNAGRLALTLLVLGGAPLYAEDAKQTHQTIIDRWGDYVPPLKLRSLLARLEPALWRATRCGDELAVALPRPTLSILDSGDPIGFALGRDHVYLSRGLIAELASEAELAFVVASAFAHACLGHRLGGTGFAPSPKNLARLFTHPSTFFAVDAGRLEQGFNPAEERAAVRRAIRTLHRARFNSDVVPALIAHLSKRQTSTLESPGLIPLAGAGFASDGPESLGHALAEAAKDAPLENLGQIGRDRFLHAIDGMVLGTQASDGVVRAHRFFHGPLGLYFEFPAGWHIQNEPHRVVGTAPSGDSLVQLNVWPAPRDTPPDEALATFFGIEIPAQSDQKETWLTENDQAYNRIIATMQTPFGEQVTAFWMTQRVSRLGPMQVAVGYASRVAPDDRIALAVAKSARHLTPDEHALTGPLRLRLLRAESGETFAGIAQRIGVSVTALRRLNRAPFDEPQPGLLLKTMR
ncbi:MAG: LysM peptidoglycan-binding domain-containing protein [Pseudomonadota bacterium]